MNLFNNNKICVIAVTSMIVMKILKKIRIIEMVQDSVKEIFLTTIFGFSIKFCAHSSTLNENAKNFYVRSVSYQLWVGFLFFENCHKIDKSYLKFDGFETVRDFLKGVKWPKSLRNLWMLPWCTRTIRFRFYGKSSVIQIFY